MILKKNIEVIPNFIDINKYIIQQDLCLHENPIQSKEFIISHVSNFRTVKNIANVIKVFYNIQKQFKAKLLMIGEGPDKTLAENLCNELGISHLVDFLGNTNQVEKKLMSFGFIFITILCREFWFSSFRSYGFQSSGYYIKCWWSS